MDDIQGRLSAFLNEYDLSAQAFERKCNIGVGVASRLSPNSRSATYAKIEKAFPMLNLDWLKTGEGEMLKPGYSSNQTVGSGIGIQGSVGHDVNQMNNSEKLFEDFISGLKTQNRLTEKSMDQTSVAMSQTDKALDQVSRALDEMSESRKMIQNLINLMGKSQN